MNTVTTQTVFAQALLDPLAATPAGLRTWNHSDPLRRLAVYRNNVVVSLVDALAHGFPVTQQLVGETFFRAMAQVFVREQPPRTRVLSHYGEALPGFIAGFAPAAGLPYLAEVARLEWMRLQALHAADEAPMSPQVLTTLLQEAPPVLAALRWRLAPSLYMLRAAHAAVSIWAAHQEDSGVVLEAVDISQPESALVFRRELEVVVLPIAAGTTAFVEQLMAGARWADAVDTAFDADAAFELSAALALLLHHGLLTGAQT